MSKICVISRDRVFARMLELELRSIGMNVKTVNEKLNPPALTLALNQCGMAVLDGEYFDDPLQFIEQTEMDFVIFSRREMPKRPDNVKAYFERPFEVSAFCEYMIGYVKQNRGEILKKNSTANAFRIELDQFSKQAVVDGNVVKFSAREFALLFLLYKNRGKTVSRKEVFETVWSCEFDEKSNVDNVYINYLRNKLDRRFGISLIHTVRGKGYMMK